MSYPSTPRARSLLLLLGCAVLPAGAGEIFVDPRVTYDFHDFHGGLRMGGEGSLGDLRISAFVDGEFTPLPNRTRYNWMEEGLRDAPGSDLYYLGPGAALAFPLDSALFLTASAGTARTFNSDAPADWSRWVDAGLRLAVGELCHVAMVWQYRPLPGTADHRLALQFRFRPV